METFEENKNAVELGIDTTREFVVVNVDVDDFYFAAGDILELDRNDKSHYPFFKRKSDGVSGCVYWNWLSYADEETNTMNKDKIEILEEKKKAIQNEIDELSKEKIDFSEFVARSGSSLIIKGEKFLASHNNGDIAYSTYIHTNSDTPDYIHTTVGELERGDMFICEYLVANITLGEFNIYVGNGVAQYLSTGSDMEVIDYSTCSLETKVIKFLRK